MNAPLAERRSRAANRSATRVMALVADTVSLTTVSSTLGPFKQTNTLHKVGQAGRITQD